jgi:hypothetical protein
MILEFDGKPFAAAERTPEHGSRVWRVWLLGREEDCRYYELSEHGPRREYELAQYCIAWAYETAHDIVPAMEAEADARSAAAERWCKTHVPGWEEIERRRREDVADLANFPDEKD